MSATPAARLPAVDCVKVRRKRSEEEREENNSSARGEAAAAFLAGVRLGSLRRVPRPGDVFAPSRDSPAGRPRPLGLIPDHGRANETFLPPLFPHLGLASLVAARELDVGHDVSGYDVRKYDGVTATFRHTERDYYSRHAPSVADDGEYENTLAKVKMQEYVTSEVCVPQKVDAAVTSTQRRRRTKTVPETGTKLLHYGHTKIGPEEYLCFVNQAIMRKKLLYLDQREAEECKECERCSGRKGRCPRCLAIRVGGGYIILDGGELPGKRRYRRNENYFNWSADIGSEMNTTIRKQNRFGLGEVSDNSMLGRGDGEDVTVGDGGIRGGWEGGARGDGQPRTGGWVGGGDGRGGRDDGGSGYDSSKGGAISGGGDRTDGDDWRNSYREKGQDGGTFSKRRDGGSQLWDGDGMDSGRQSNMGQRPGSRRSGSRPGSRLGPRPPSSVHRLGRGTERRKGLNLERDGGKVREGGETDEDEERTRRRRKGKREGEEDDDEHGEGRQLVHGYHREEDDMEAAKSGSLGDLMRFKAKKRDDVKALRATLKELHDIDPLDYLARYCIIDQEKVPHYRRVYNNVDRDEDDEIDILELDFALKAVNFDLISDSELSYINSVLELAGRHKLNFRFFSLIAALSEKVVALDGMVKRLINKMDFEALEVKLKKCKELFYLLADTEHETVEQGGVVTVGSLAVELQAGGLTQEHVEYVCDHMNHEDRGFVEFLDYLTYVPLFVEIHDTIYDNPLDFTRTK